MASDPSSGWRREAHAGAYSALVLAALGYAALLVAWRPVSPFEWDEFLFLRALDRYDPAVHSPQPPGYPAFVATCKLALLLVGDPVLATQLVAVAGAVLALIGVAALGRTLDLPRSSAVLAMAVLAAMPAFVFYSNVGLSDIPATGTGIIAAWSLVAARSSPRRLPLAAALTAVACAFRPQVLLLLLPLGVWAVCAVVRARRVITVIVATIAGAAVTVACWLPAILITGSARFFTAISKLLNYVGTVEKAFRLPAAPLAGVLQSWLVQPFGGAPGAVTFWTLAGIGGWGVLRSRGWPAFLSLALPAGCYLAAGMFTMDAPVAARYCLPAVPFVALLVGSACAIGGRMRRSIAVLACAGWVAGEMLWVAPAVSVRKEPAPVSACLSFVAERYDLLETDVVWHPVVNPHAEYVLWRDGGVVWRSRNGPSREEGALAGPETVIVGPELPAGARKIFEKHWACDPLERMTRGRYYSCSVGVAPQGAARRELDARRIGAEQLSLEREAILTLPARSSPMAFRLETGSAPLSLHRAGFAPEPIPPSSSRILVVMPGPAGAVSLSPAPGEPPGHLSVRLARREPSEAIPYLSSAFMLPEVAAISGAAASVWRTDLMLHNPHAWRLSVVLELVGTESPNAHPRHWPLDLEAGETIWIRDVLDGPPFRSGPREGALYVHATDCDAKDTELECTFLLFSRTRSVTGPVPIDRIGEGLPGVPLRRGLGSGATAVFENIPWAPTTRVNFGAASRRAGAATVRVSLRDKGLTETWSAELEVPPLGHIQRRLPTTAASNALLVEIKGLTAPGGVFPYLDILDADQHVTTHLLPGGEQ